MVHHISLITSGDRGEEALSGARAEDRAAAAHGKVALGCLGGGTGGFVQFKVLLPHVKRDDLDSYVVTVTL